MIGPPASEWPAATFGWCQRCDRPIRTGAPYCPMIPFVGSWGGFMHQHCPPQLVVLAGGRADEIDLPEWERELLQRERDRRDP